MFQEALASNESIFWAGIQNNINLDSTHKKVIVAEKIVSEYESKQRYYYRKDR